MIFTVGQQILGGSLEVVSIDTSTGVITASSTFLGDGVNGNQYTITFTPSTTIAAVQQAIEAAQALAQNAKAPV